MRSRFLRSAAPMVAALVLAGCMASQNALIIPQVGASSFCGPDQEHEICALYKSASSMREQYNSVLQDVNAERLALESGSLLAAALTAGYTLFGAHEGNVRASVFGVGLFGAARTQPNRTERIAILSDAIFSLDCLMVSTSVMAEVYQPVSGEDDAPSRLLTMQNLAIDLASTIPEARNLPGQSDEAAQDRALLESRISAAEAALVRLQEGIGAEERYPATFRSVQARVARDAFTRWETGRGSVEGLVDSILALRTQEVATPTATEDNGVQKRTPPPTARELSDELQGFINQERSLNPARYTQQYRELANCAIRAAGG